MEILAALRWCYLFWCEKWTWKVIHINFMNILKSIWYNISVSEQHCHASCGLNDQSIVALLKVNVPNTGICKYVLYQLHLYDICLFFVLICFVFLKYWSCQISSNMCNVNFDTGSVWNLKGSDPGEGAGSTHILRCHNWMHLSYRS